jgi:hypothetical protein
MAKASKKSPKQKDLRVKKPGGAELKESELERVSGGVQNKVLLSGPFDDRVGDRYTHSGDPAK